jgi:hypothetical protein
MNWTIFPANHALNWATDIVSNRSNTILTISNVNWAIENVDWATFHVSYERNWASIIVN